MPKNPQRVLVVDDEENMRSLLEIVLSGAGYQVVCAEDNDSAMDLIKQNSLDLVLTDLRIGSDRDAGMRLLTWLRDDGPGIPAIMMTAYGSVETAIDAMKSGAVDYIMKPFKNDEIKLVVKRALDERALRRENKALRTDQARRGDIENIVGKSAAIEALRDVVRRVAGLSSTIAIHGESGTGKELVARGIHQLSDRADKPFVALNCGGVPENLLESELFGHKKGAFTGAHEDKEGLFVAADGGSLFLDEIGEMPLSLQVKLLRVLDNNVVTPIGATTGHEVDVRIISATNRVLEDMVKEGTFREDLFYRLNVIPVEVPPLRDRADDVPLLARHFVSAASEKMNRNGVRLSAEAESVLSAFAWPGNVRELQNVIERAVALATGDDIDLGDLPPLIRDYVSEVAETAASLPDGGCDLEEIIADIEIGLIKQALDNARYSQKKAAELLGLTPRSLRYRLQKYGLQSD
jgi:two-component system, NtrC family, response regulator PilR